MENHKPQKESLNKQSSINQAINDIVEKCKVDLKLYNELMENLFDSLEKATKFLKKKSKLFSDGSSLKIIIKNMKKNALKIFQYLKNLKESENLEVYYALSCIYGAFLGDATGAYCEFNQPSQENIKRIFNGNPIFGNAPGQVTDDSEMAMSMAYGILTNPEFDNLNSIYLYYFYGAWCQSGPNDMGNTTRKALYGFNFKGYDPNNEKFIKKFNEKMKNIENDNKGSLANGFLMRISPFVTWCFFRFYDSMKNIYVKEENGDDLVELFIKIKEQAKNDNKCTHPEECLQNASAFFTIIATGAMFKLSPKKIINNIKNLLKNPYFNEENSTKKKNENSIESIILKELNRYDDSHDVICSWNYFTNIKSVYSCMGYYVHAFRLTLYYLYYFDKYDKDKDNKYSKYRVIMNEICSFGGDTDTNAAIVGAVIGPLIGYKNFGEEFEKMVTVVDENRYIFSPCLMVLYVHFLIESNNKKVGGKKEYFLEMILNFMYGDIDEKFFAERIKGNEDKVEDMKKK